MRQFVIAITLFLCAADALAKDQSEKFNFFNYAMLSYTPELASMRFRNTMWSGGFTINVGRLNYWELYYSNVSGTAGTHQDGGANILRRSSIIGGKYFIIPHRIYGALSFADTQLTLRHDKRLDVVPDGEPKAPTETKWQDQKLMGISIAARERLLSFASVDLGFHWQKAFQSKLSELKNFDSTSREADIMRDAGKLHVLSLFLNLNLDLSD